MRATNTHTGKLQEVVLVEPRRLEEAALVESFPELRVDLTRAMDNFNVHQRRVLFRVLVQGQSLEKATRGMKKTLRWWQDWYHRMAMPLLRSSLRDYMENGKLVI